MTNPYKPTISSRIKIPPHGRGAFFHKVKRVMPEINALKVKQTVAYPVKSQKEVNRKASVLQSRKSSTRDYMYRTTVEKKKVMFRVWRTV